MEICTGVPGPMQVIENGKADGGSGIVQPDLWQYCSNALHQPLGSLSMLPPELRNIIYHLLLGGQHYHVYAHTQKSYTPDPLPIDRIPSSSSDSRAIRIYLYKCSIRTHDAKREWLDEHLSCFVDRNVLLPDLPFLRTCKAIYHEAGLVPYTGNSFIFIAPRSFECFVLDTLLPVQASALRKIDIWSPIGALPIMDENVSWSAWMIPKQIYSHNLLEGLQQVTLHFSLYGEVQSGQIHGVDKLLDLAVSAGVTSRLLKVNLTFNEGGRFEDEPEVDVNLVREHIDVLKKIALAQQAIRTQTLESMA